MPSMALAQNSLPFLLSTSSGMPLMWNHGPMYNVLLTSGSVRINSLGIQWCVLCGPPAMDLSGMTLLAFLSGMHGWSDSFLCEPSKNAFCKGNMDSSVLTLFPTLSVEVSPNENISFVSSTTHKCHSQTAGRNIVLTTSGYQVSLCDLIDGKLDFVWDVSAGRVHWQQYTKPLWWTTCVTLSCLFFFTRVCEHLSLLVRGKYRQFSVFTTSILIVMLILSRLLLHVGVLKQHLVTREEVLLNLVLEFYCWIYILAEISTFCFSRQKSNLYTYEKFINSDVDYENSSDENLLSRGEDIQEENTTPVESTGTLGSLIAVQLLLTSHLQDTYDNAFLGVLLLLFASRSFLKFLNFMVLHTQQKRSPTNDITVMKKLIFLVADLLTLTCILELAVRTAARSSTEYASTATSMLIISSLGGAFLHSVISLRIR